MKWNDDRAANVNNNVAEVELLWSFLHFWSAFVALMPLCYSSFLALSIGTAHYRLVGFFRLDQRNDVANLPKFVGHASGHCRRNA
ncbi:hypothetical protein ACVDG8_016815 [Mesorhizobium sp. ORM8.1]